MPTLTASGRAITTPWGQEVIWAETDRYVGKLLVIEAGARLSLHLHVRREEWILVLSGSIDLLLEDEHDELQVHALEPHDSARIPPGRQHRLVARDRAQLVEVSSPERDDVVRLADDYEPVEPHASSMR